MGKRPQKRRASARKVRPPSPMPAASSLQVQPAASLMERLLAATRTAERHAPADAAALGSVVVALADAKYKASRGLEVQGISDDVRKLLDETSKL